MFNDPWERSNPIDGPLLEPSTPPPPAYAEREVYEWPTAAPQAFAPHPQDISSDVEC